MLETEPPFIIEVLIHLLEISVVVGIGIIIYINKKYSTRINREMVKKDESQIS
jgi:hypothetical protein